MAPSVLALTVKSLILKTHSTRLWRSKRRQAEKHATSGMERGIRIRFDESDWKDMPDNTKPESDGEQEVERKGIGRWGSERVHGEMLGQ